MGMLLRRRSDEAKKKATTSKSLHSETGNESVKDEKPKTVKRGRPTKQ